MDMDRTPQQQAHYDKYESLAQQVGVRTLFPYMPADRDTVARALKDDKILNNIPLHLWDQKVGYCPRSNKTLFFGIWSHKAVRHLSVAERVCLLKHVARYYYTEL
jgi:hypothetical protein